ncbi:MAG TPA: hypothetical protein VFN48_09760 [Solirubrobacteraceae bacterium]|nr:hypothetical protein [Solirubrobacteraceae bacterium]
MSTLRTIERTALDSSLKLVRIPLDTAIRLLPGADGGRGAAVALLVDQADASVRRAAGTLLGDEVVREDAERRSAAVQERRRAAELRARAAQTAEASNERLAQREQAADEQRRRAAATAEKRRQAADRTAKAKAEAAQTSAAQRQRANREATAKAEQAIGEREDQAKLRALEEKEAALTEKEKALTASDESQRLAAAAAQAKAERKHH